MNIEQLLQTVMELVYTIAPHDYITAQKVDNKVYGFSDGKLILTVEL